PEIHMVAIWIPASCAASPMRFTSSAASDGEISLPNRTSIPSKPAFFACLNFSVMGMPSGKITEQIPLVKRVDGGEAAAIRLPAAVVVINCLLFMRSPQECNAARVRAALYKAAAYVFI